MADNRIVRKLFHIFWMLKRPMTLGVRAFLRNDVGEILLVRHTYVSGWHLPGGGIEPGETALEAVKKEVREEASIELLEEPNLFSIYMNRNISRRDHVLLFECGTWHQSSTFEPNREIAEIGFFPPDSLPEETTPGTQKRIAEVLGHQEISHHW